MARSEFRFVHRLRVRWAEVDKQGIVFNGCYLTYFDVGVTEYYRALGHPYPMKDLLAAGLDLYARKAQIEFHAAAEYDDGWLYRIDVTGGDDCQLHRNPDGELWVSDFEVTPMGNSPSTKTP